MFQLVKTLHPTAHAQQHWSTACLNAPLGLPLGCAPQIHLHQPSTSHLRCCRPVGARCKASKVLLQPLAAVRALLQQVWRAWLLSMLPQGLHLFTAAREGAACCQHLFRQQQQSKSRLQELSAV